MKIDLTIKLDNQLSSLLLVLITMMTMIMMIVLGLMMIVLDNFLMMI